MEATVTLYIIVAKSKCAYVLVYTIDMKHFFAIAVKPPKLAKPYGPTLGYAAAALSALLVVIHLSNIDALSSMFAVMVGGNQTLASYMTAGIIFVELFAIPFALRFKLSPAAQFVSGFLIVAVPLKWLVISLWLFSIGLLSQQFGNFAVLQDWLTLIFLNVVWLLFALVTVCSLGYNNIQFKKGFRKYFK